MDKRFFLALVLTALVIILTPRLFPPPGRTTVAAPGDSVAAGARPPAASPAAPSPAARDAGPPAEAAVPSTVAAVPPLQGGGAPVAATPQTAAETTTVEARRSRYAFSSRGAAPIAVTLDSYPSQRPSARGARAQLARPGVPLARYTVVLGRDTLALDSVTLRSASLPSAGARAPTLAYTATVAGREVSVRYAFAPDSFLVHAAVTAAGAPPRSALLLGLPMSLQSNEADTLDDVNQLAVSYRPVRGDVASTHFSKLDPGAVVTENAPVNWVAVRSKYFLVAFRAPPTSPFAGVQLRGMDRVGKLAPFASTTAVLPLDSTGTARFDIYAGPQDFERLQHLGGDLEQVNPYAGWLHGVVQPFATVVMRALLWMKRTTQLNYGWVLVLFGVIIRLALWPLNQSAMRTSMKMQRLQPELQAVQKRHASDPKRQQEAIMKIYKEHGMSPLSPLMGCLPMLLPMPILFALYFVFNNTIEFRGVSFLWLPDISLRDPLYLTPLLMGASMYLMSWIGMRNQPPNPQAKMMSYMMPVMLTVLFLNFASGLNLYYFVQNIAALPQQWLLARERSKTAPA